MMMADGAAPYICSTLVPFRFGFAFPIPCSLEATHTRELKERERRNRFNTFMERNLYISQWMKVNFASSRATIKSLRFKSKQTEQKKNCLAICHTESRVVGAVDKIKDKRDLFGHLTLSHSQINNQHCIQFCSRGCCYRFALMHWHYPICQSFIWTNIRAAS